MVRAWVALAWGLKESARSSSNSATETPRRPSSMASMSPAGPPPGDDDVRIGQVRWGGMGQAAYCSLQL